MSTDAIARLARVDTYSYIIESEAENLTDEDRIEILTRVARKKSHRQFIHESGGGTTIRLDQLPESTILMIFNFMKERLQLTDPF